VICIYINHSSKHNNNTDSTPNSSTEERQLTVLATFIQANSKQTNSQIEIMANNGRSSPLLQLFNGSSSTNNNEDQNNSSSASSLMRSFSKCFDPRVDDAIVEDKDGIGQAAAVKGGKGEFLHR
jgi:hypothetical protein